MEDTFNGRQPSMEGNFIDGQLSLYLSISLYNVHVVRKLCVFVGFVTLGVHTHPVCSFILLHCVFVPNLCVNSFCDNVHTSPSFVLTKSQFSRCCGVRKAQRPLCRNSSLHKAIYELVYQCVACVSKMYIPLSQSGRQALAGTSGTLSIPFPPIWCMPRPQCVPSPTHSTKSIFCTTRFSRLSS